MQPVSFEIHIQTSIKAKKTSQKQSLTMHIFATHLYIFGSHRAIVFSQTHSETVLTTHFPQGNTIRESLR